MKNHFGLMPSYIDDLRPFKTNATMLLLEIIFSLALFTVGVNAEACNKRITLTSSSNWKAKFKYEAATYVIKVHLNLNGQVLVVPNKSTLLFKGGSIRNGTVIGNNTKVCVGKSLVFVKVRISGTWQNDKVYSEWMDFVEGEKVDNAQNFKNLMTLCSGDMMTDLYMQSGTFYCSVAAGSSNIKIPSNVYWHNQATLRQLSTSSPKYGFVLLHKSDNVTIDGGVFVGDVQTHTGSDGEWGHGIKLAGATNVVLKNLTCKEFWGDGIDVIEGRYNTKTSAGEGICSNITIDNVKCLYNRRQGISIEAGKNVLVKNSEFAYTGKYGIADPGCGVDIEPWCTNEVKVDNLNFYNCNIHDNHPQRDFCLEPNLIRLVKKGTSGNVSSNNITIDKCKTGKLLIHGANTVNIKDCIIDEICHYNQGKNIRMDNCTFKKKSDLKKRMGLILSRCK